VRRLEEESQQPQTVGRALQENVDPQTAEAGPGGEAGALLQAALTSFQASEFVGSPIDPEFGGVEISEDADRVVIRLVGEGLADRVFLDVLLQDLGASLADVQQLPEDGSSLVELNGGLSAEVDATSAGLTVAIGE
jgi:hypothetical protein